MLGGILLIVSVVVNILLLKRIKREKNLRMRLHKIYKGIFENPEARHTDYSREKEDIDVVEPVELAKVHTMTFYKDSDGEWRWRIKARNGHIIGASSQGYVRRDDCENNTLSIAASVRAHNFTSNG